MATTTQNNGVRKTLASQIDRLDIILDGLADNLNEAVATAAAGAVREVVTVAVQEAVHSALVEVLTNAEIQKRLAATQTVIMPAPVPLLVRIAGKARSCLSWLGSTVKGAWTKMTAMVKAYCSKVKATAQPLITAASDKAHKAGEQAARHARTGWMLATALAGLAKRFRKQLALAVGVGILVGVACYLGGREIASIGCGLAGFVGSLASDTLSRLRRLLPQRMVGTS